MKLFIPISRTFSLTIILGAACLFAACSKEETGAKSATALDVFGITRQEPNLNVKEIFFTNDPRWERKTDFLADPEKNISSIDGSEITKSEDNFGNITYRRVFSNDARLESVVIVSSPGGNRVAYVYGKGNGRVTRLTDETAEKGLELPVEDLADRAGLSKPATTYSSGKTGIGSSLPVKNIVTPEQTREAPPAVYQEELPQTAEKDPVPLASAESRNTEQRSEQEKLQISENQ